MNGYEAYRRLRFIAGNCVRLLSSPWRQFDVATNEARTVFGASFGDLGWHHLRKTLEEVDAFPGLHFTHTTLYRFLTRFTPRSTADFVRTSDGLACTLPLFVYPWGTFRKAQYASDKDPAQSRFCGPSDDAFVEAEFARTIDLYRQVRENGYRPWSFGHSFIGGTLLVRRSGERRFVVLQGNHRLAILAHLGTQRVSVRYQPGNVSILREHEASSWALVQSGDCSIEVAMKVFDLFFVEDGHHIAVQIS